jgi:hypothetical protein
MFLFSYFEHLRVLRANVCIVDLFAAMLVGMMMFMELKHFIRCRKTYDGYPWAPSSNARIASQIHLAYNRTKLRGDGRSTDGAADADDSEDPGAPTTRTLNTDETLMDQVIQRRMSMFLDIKK